MTKRVTIRRGRQEKVAPSILADGGSLVGTTISGQRVLLSDLANWINTSMQGRAENLDAFLNEQGIRSLSRALPVPPPQIRTTTPRAEIEIEHETYSRCYSFRVTIPPIFSSQTMSAQMRITSEELQHLCCAEDGGALLLDRATSALASSLVGAISDGMRLRMAEVLRNSPAVRNSLFRPMGRDV